VFKLKAKLSAGAEDRLEKYEEKIGMLQDVRRESVKEKEGSRRRVKANGDGDN